MSRESGSVIYLRFMHGIILLEKRKETRREVSIRDDIVCRLLFSLLCLSRMRKREVEGGGGSGSNEKFRMWYVHFAVCLFVCFSVLFAVFRVVFLLLSPSIRL